MSGNATRASRDHTGEWLVVLRVFVLSPALVTLLALGASALRSRDSRGDVGPAAVELRAAQGSRTLGEPRFGPPLTNVFSAESAARTPGGWVVLDGRAQQIVFLDDVGGLVSISGRPGAGPGELLDAVELAVVDSLVVVVDAGGQSLDLFGLDGGFRKRVSTEHSGCAGAPVKKLLGEESTLAMLSLCARTDGSTSALVERVQLNGERHVLLDRVFVDFASGKMDPSLSPLLGRSGGKLHFVIAPDRCVTVLEASAGEVGSVCHPDDHPIAIPDSLKTTFRALEPKVSALGAELIIPERFPPFDGLVDVGGRLAFHVLIDDRTHALEIVQDDHLERVILPAGADFAVGGGSLLLARQRPEGTAFAVLPLR